ncbi:MAG: hypothetical protein JWP29_3167 [Rhodoferax sp.]|nr:hypothetical protein [Rhodoferax sp.]
MQISSSTAVSGRASSAGSAGDGNQIDKLQKQLRALTEELKGVVAEDIDAKQKQAKAELLMAEIQMVQAQIQAIQQAQAQAQLDAQRAAGDSSAAGDSARPKAGGTGGLVDAYA